MCRNRGVCGNRGRVGLLLRHGSEARTPLTLPGHQQNINVLNLDDAHSFASNHCYSIYTAISNSSTIVATMYHVSLVDTRTSEDTNPPTVSLIKNSSINS